MQAKLRLVFSISIFFFCFYLGAQQGYWKQKVASGMLKTPGLATLDSDFYPAFTLQKETLKQQLNQINDSPRTLIVQIPDIEGQLQNFLVRETPVFSSELQRKYPEIRSYSGIGLGNKQSRINFSISPSGFQGMVVSHSGDTPVFIDPVQDRTDTYVVYQRKGVDSQTQRLVCETESNLAELGKSPSTLKLTDDQNLRTYRLAVATTGEYSDFHGGTVIGALSAINATLTRVNEVFQRDLAIRLELIGNTDQVIYLDAATDPFGGNFSSEVQTTLSTEIGEAAYDIGHLFHAGAASGNAGFIGSVCVNNRKGSAFSSTPNPQGDVFDLDYVAHEMGHQFGANHTWSFDSEGTLVQAEPGSGTTIMGYAGIANENNVATNGDDYFHYFSILQISDYVQSIGCGTISSLSNTPPDIVPVQDYLIPVETAFRLEGVATDVDPADVLTYTWEQVDDGVVTTNNFGPELAGGALFRSRPPSTDTHRYFPNLNRILNDQLTETNPDLSASWETVPTIERAMNFAFVVRDNGANGGQVSSDLVKVSTVNAAGPFRVTSQASAISYRGGSIQNVTWNVAGTNLAPINTQNVDILLSEDGGQTFSHVLAAGVPNTGSYNVQLPVIETQNGRIMVRASGNIYFSINTAPITLEAVDFALLLGETEYDVCAPADVVIPLNYETYNGFSDPVTLDVIGLPAGVTAVFSQNPVSTDTSLNLTLSNTVVASPGYYDLNINMDDGNTVRNLPVKLRLADGISPPLLLLPQNNEVEVPLNPSLSWEAIAENVSYDLEIARDAAFTDVVLQTNLATNSYAPGVLQESTTYFWRVRSVNPCGEGAYSAPFQFTTIAVNCLTKSASNLPLTIPASGTHLFTREILIADDLNVAGVDVVLDIEHTFLSDLVISLTSPSGTKVTLLANSCGDGNDVTATFDQDAAAFLCGNNPAIGGTVKPLGSLNSFLGESSAGIWTLTLEDIASADGGSLNAFDLVLCLEGELRPDADGDGVFDDGDDLCPGTPPGVEVDVNGCEVFRFDPDFFELILGSTSCVGTTDGSIGITPQQNFNFTASLQGNGIDRSENFTTGIVLENLPAGTYSLCLDGNDGTNTYQQQCFEVVITSPDPISVSGIVQDALGSVLLELQGSQTYTINWNGESFTTDATQISLPLEKKANTLSVRGELPCQGSFEALYINSSEVIASPNPFRDVLEIFIPFQAEEVEVLLFNAAGGLVRRSLESVNQDKVQLDLAFLPEGIYFLKVTDGVSDKGIKIIKE